MKKLLFSLTFLFIAHLHASDAPYVLKEQVPMRDGKFLPIDIYLPSEEAKNLACILVRSPAGSHQKTAMEYTQMVKNGYAVAIQGTRSSIDSEGKTIPYRSDGWMEQQDGYDTVEWLAKHPVTNGRIGTLGSSAQGITQLLMAPSAPPSLKCQYISFAAPTMRDHAIYPNGKLMRHQVEAWLSYYARDTGVFSFAANHQFYDEFWDDFDSLKVVDRVKVPAVFQGGWFDIFIQGTIDAFVARQERGGSGAKNRQKLIIGPWTHFWPMVTKLGDFQVPANGFRSPFDLSPLDWFDYYLKEKDNHVEESPSVIYYVMGPFDGSSPNGNVWRVSDIWPVPATETDFYLSSDNLLSQDLLSVKSGKEKFKHDPSNPVPTIGGHNLFIDSGPMDQSPIEKRDDVLTFSTGPLKEDLEVTGRIRLKLYVESDCLDTDFAIRLTDVYPDGRSILITDGTYRTGLLLLKNKDLSSLNKQEIDIDLSSTSLVFAKGHAIRISISGSNYPRYELNHNTGFLASDSQKQVIASNIIYFGKETPSRLILPVFSQNPHE